MYIITKILVIGSNTRAISKSLKQLGYTVYATSFFDLVDQRNFVDKLIVPSDFNDFDLKILEDLALDYVNEVDYVIASSDINMGRFPKSKVIGNYDTEPINNKYKMYKKLYKNFLLPDTYKLNDIQEAFEIVNNNPDKKYIVKPIYGSGGLNINYFNKNSNINSDFLLQEYIQGNSVSSSFVSYLDDHSIDMIAVSDQIIGSKRLGANSEFVYCGNITPFINYNPKVLNISNKISKMFKLVGLNGIDFILHNNNVYVIEVNPRITGSFESIEKSFDINLIESHINSCNNVRLNQVKPNKFTVKLIPYSLNDSYYKLSSINNIRDRCHDNFLIKKGFPIATILISDRILENAMIKSEMILKQVMNSKKV